MSQSSNDGFPSAMHIAAAVTLKQAAPQLGCVDEATFDRVVDPAKMMKPDTAAAAT
jgi:fumarate hydratase class II